MGEELEEGWEWADEATQEDFWESGEFPEKTRFAAKCSQDTLEAMVAAVKPGVKVSELVALGYSKVEELLGKFPSKMRDGEPIKLGTCMPICVSLNGTICHQSLPDETEVKEGDLVHIDLGAHVAGFPTMTATTVIAREDNSKPVDGKLGDLIAAAQACLDVAVKGVRPGNMSGDITSMWGTVAEAYGVNLAEGVLSHEMKRFVIDGAKSFISKVSPEQPTESFEFETRQMWGIDIVLTTGNGKFRMGEARPSVFKRAPDHQRCLKTASGRSLISDVNKRFMNFPFSVSQFEDKRALLGVAEAVKSEQLTPLPMLVERNGEACIHIKSTVMVTTSAIEKVTGPILAAHVSERQIEDKAVNDHLKRGLSLKKKKGKK